MTPKEKGQELLINFCNIIKNPELDYLEDAKECALLAVDEILKLVSNDLDLYYKDCIFWEQVKLEIESL
jgi:hypothetical protein